ncbi:hypothetical protein PTH_1592 [Pelotomaculum thermopropionicum SI]|uniref:Uncharacterized protein n=1 Tax=Pelotomaculum thermopropionicum (strain DSM 13744 / JCM 10971 / SI) TaxID=370438 RepID=A5D1W8_PELTS|nr:hypothetical protein PTH_1592 [Pelotomaculum thermopropionicum SI]
MRLRPGLKKLPVFLFKRYLNAPRFLKCFLNNKCRAGLNRL